MRNERGFTLLETMIAMGIMLVAFASILMVQSGSLNASAKAKQMNIVAMLARNAMIEAEQTFEGKQFEEVDKEKEGKFPNPYQDFRWKRSIKEIKFPSLGIGGGKGEKKDGEGANDKVEMLAKLFTNFLSKAVREVTVTVIWNRGSGDQSFAVSTYWVDLNHEFALSE